jgi:hypothetical protein
MENEIIPGFSALEFKAEAQQRVHDDIRGMTPEERMRYFHEAAEEGPFADRWRRLPEAVPIRCEADAAKELTTA